VALANAVGTYTPHPHIFLRVPGCIATVIPSRIFLHRVKTTAFAQVRGLSMRSQTMTTDARGVGDGDPLAARCPRFLPANICALRRGLQMTRMATDCNFCNAVNLLDPQDLVVPCTGCGMLLRNHHREDTTTPAAAVGQVPDELL
jgi:hypothetical protein